MSEGLKDQLDILTLLAAGAERPRWLSRNLH